MLEKEREIAENKGINRDLGEGVGAFSVFFTFE